MDATLGISHVLSGCTQACLHKPIIALSSRENKSGNRSVWAVNRPSLSETLRLRFSQGDPNGKDWNAVLAQFLIPDGKVLCCR